MKARVILEVTFELAAPEEYQEEVRSWEEAARADAEFLTVQHADGLDVTMAIGAIEILGEQEFRRTDAGEEG